MKKQSNSDKIKNLFASCSFSWHHCCPDSYRNSLVLFVFMASISLQAFSQTETFDIATYTPPKDFKKEAKPGVVNFTNVKAATGKFCVITLYASTASTGDVQKDFTGSWKELAVTPYKADANPKTETQKTPDGWNVLSAASQAKLDGNEFYVFLTVVSGFGKTMNIRASLNDMSYTETIDAFLAALELDKTKTNVMPDTNKPTPQTTGGAGTFGSMNYNAPSGWSHQVFPDGVVFKPVDLPANEHLSVQIMPPLSFSGSLEQALQQSYNEAALMYNGTMMHDVNGGNYSAIAAKKSFRGWEYIRCSGGLHIGSGDYPAEFGLDLFVIKINNRFERIAVLKSRTINRSCSMSSFYADERQEYRTAIDNLLFSIHFKDGEEAILKPGTTNGTGITGVWQGISMSVGSPSVGQPLGAGYKVFSPIFLSNGQAYFGPKFPAEGLYETDTRVRAELYRRDWGTYSFNNGKGILKMPYADIPLRMEGTKLIITANQTDHRFYKLPSVDGATFNGTYVMAEAYGKIPAITFTTDGRFTDNGAIRVLYHEYSDCINPALLPGSGTYEVKDYSITFTYSDGRKIKIAFLGTEYDIKNQSPAVLRMSNNEDPMTKR